MARSNKRGLVDRLLLGKEKSEDYARNSLPSNRWELFWDIFKGRFTKLCIVNLLTIIFLIPLVAVYFISQTISASYGLIIPYSQGFGVGYQALYTLTGVSESINVNNALIINLLYSVAFIFAGLGFSGGAYIMRNIVWTEGIFVSNDFWRGLKLNAKQLVLYYLFLSVFFYVSRLTISFSDAIIASGFEQEWLLVISKVFSYLILMFVLFMALHGTSLCVTYELKFKQLLKNSFLLTIGFLPFNIVFGLAGGIFVLLCLLGGYFQVIGTVILILFGISWFMLVWTDYSQWIFDRYINDKVPGAKKNKGIYAKTSSNKEAKSLQQYREQMALIGRSTLSDKPIKPITDDEIVIAELPTSFSRADIERLNESKQIMFEDNERYIEEHKNDPEFQPTEEDLERQRILEEREKRIEKAKKELSKRKHK